MPKLKHNSILQYAVWKQNNIASALCRLFEKRLYKKLLENRKRLRRKLTLARLTSNTNSSSSKSTNVLTQTFDEYTSVSNLFCFCTPYEIVAVLTQISRTFALYAASDISVLLLIKRLYIRPTSYQRPEDKIREDHWIGNFPDQCLLDDYALAQHLKYNRNPDDTKVTPIALNNSDVVELKPSSIDGTGVFASRKIKASEPLLLVTGSFFKYVL